MEKGQESKQKRKTPLTTIAISQEYAKKLDEYLNGTGITRKEFVELSVDYFQRTGFDLRGEAFDLSPLEKVAGRLEQSAKIMERHNEGTEAVHLLLQAVREQTAKQLPAPELIAHAAEEKAKAEAGIEFMFGTEIEFYLFQLDQNGNPAKVPFDQAGYMDIAPEDKGENIRRDICFTLEQMGIIPEASHHEEGPGQNEIDFHYSDPVSAADNNSTFKWIVRTKAFGNGLCADFSPKPIADEAGSGMHINLSYKVPEKEDRPEIFDYIIGGILNNIKDMTYFLNPSRQSYLRLGEFKAPKYIAYGRENRSTCLRIPATKGDRRIEIRSPDPGCNPYIAYTLLIYAALDGIKNKSIPPKEVTENLFDSDSAASLKLDLLPSTLEKAHKNAAASKFITTYLGKEFIKKYGI